MADRQSKTEEPRGLGEHTRGLAAEYAHEQGWGLDQQERTHQAAGQQDVDGGAEYDYGAQDFGDSPRNASPDPAGIAATNTQDANSKESE